MTDQSTTAGPLAGIRILEVANWLAAPAGCALLADAGADVIKVEPPTGDAYRGYRAQAGGYFAPFNFAFELDNRGKRGITLDLDNPSARHLIYRLIGDCDVFVTNLLAGRRGRYGLNYDDLKAYRPDLIFVSVTGYGSWGPDRNRPGYDYAAFWARSGIMNLLGEPESPPPPQRPGMGDHTTALAVSGAVSMALFHRERTGKGEQIDVSLNNTGLWVLGIDVQSALSTGQENARVSRRSVPNPIWNSYQTGDGRWIQLVMLVADVYWPKLCRAVGRSDLEDDPRFDSMPKRTENRKELIALLDDVFAQRPLEDWTTRLDGEGCIWAPAQTISEAINHPQTLARKAFAEIEHPTHGRIRLVDTPVKFSDAQVSVRGPAPELGQHTEEVLLGAGYGWDEIAKLRESGVL
ncbi:MAG TPA: CoA transferase [Dehalococcoidia bacterium]|nr:CoA transferase [Dehalococcoidia bacterium]